MISIILSTYRESYITQIRANIYETIGVPYEIIEVHNPGIYSISQAYNIGAVKAKFDILCFVHEDIKFHTLKWGRNLLYHFNTNPKLGLIGIAGSTQKLLVPGGWGHYVNNKNKINIIQPDRSGKNYRLSTFTGEKIENLKVIDGVFMVTRKFIWQEIPFDETILGYHLYDIDFSLQVSQKYKVAIAYDILIEHFSHGNYNDDWIQATLKYHQNNEKKHLFDKADINYSRARKIYYASLVKSKISFKAKRLYIKYLGIDIRSIPAVLMFIFPLIGRPLLAIYKKIK